MNRSVSRRDQRLKSKPDHSLMTTLVLLSGGLAAPSWPARSATRGCCGVRQRGSCVGRAEADDARSYAEGAGIWRAHRSADVSGVHHARRLRADATGHPRPPPAYRHAVKTCISPPDLVLLTRPAWWRPSTARIALRSAAGRQSVSRREAAVLQRDVAGVALGLDHPIEIATRFSSGVRKTCQARRRATRAARTHVVVPEPHRDRGIASLQQVTRAPRACQQRASATRRHTLTLAAMSWVLKFCGLQFLAFASETSSNRRTS